MIAGTDGNPFSGDGDSGSVVFSQTPFPVMEGMENTYPAVGLVSAIVSNGTFTAACSMETVFSVLDVNTLCSGAIAQLIDSIGNTAPNMMMMRVDPKGRQLRELRDAIFPETTTGAALAAVLMRKAPLLSGLWFRDATARGLVVRAFRNWILAPSNFELLRMPISTDDIAASAELFAHLGAALPDEAPVFDALHSFLASGRGATLGELLAARLELP